MPVIDIIAGARPNFVKIAPIIAALDGLRAADGALRYRLVHTGQHYDAALSGEFFKQLRIPAPDVNLEVGSGTQAEQAAAIMVGYETLVMREPSELCLVVGDVTSTMACAVVAKKCRMRVAHVEGGIRSNDWSMPEEINRIVTDSISDFFFTTSASANENLRRQGIADSQVFFVGNTMIDTLLANGSRLRPPSLWSRLRLEAGGYFLATLHRPANVDRVETLSALLKAIGEGCRSMPVVLPVHPRTAKVLCELTSIPANIAVVVPQPYLEFSYLLKHAKAVLTDSGGVTEEATVFGVPCLTLRDTTERPETVSIGTNVLVGTNPANLAPVLDMLFRGEWKKGTIPPLWDGHTGERIAAHLCRILGSNAE